MLSLRGRLLHLSRDEQGVLEVFERDGIRSLYFGNDTRQSSMACAQPERLVLAYTRAMLAPLLFLPPPRRVLLIGLGGGALLRWLHRHCPQARLEVIELRPAVVDVCRRQFGLPEAPSPAVHVGDAVTLLPTLGGGYDLILLDAYDRDGLAPGIGEPGFFAACRAALSREGVLAANLWSSDRGRFRRLRRAFREGLEGRVLELPVKGRANRILLGLPGTADWSAAAERAEQLTRTTDVAFDALHEAMWRRHAPAATRLAAWLGFRRARTGSRS